jgi:acetyl-CoA C-acetyltransferase
MSQPIFILGGSQTDFAVNWTREGRSIFDLLSAAVTAALEDARTPADTVEVAHIGNFAGELFTGQGMLGGFLGHIDARLAGVPAARHEGACASGSLAILAAMADLEAGRYDTALVAGIELMRNVSGHTAAGYLGAAAWVGEEAVDAQFVWPSLFSDLAEEYDRRYGLKREHLAALAQKNFANARANPNAQTRGWTLTPEHFSEDDALNPVVEGRMRRHDCSQISDGACALVLATERSARAWAAANGVTLESLPRIRGWGHTTAPMRMDTKLAASAGEAYALPWTRKAITDAYARAGISGPDELDAIETHDCFTITEYAAIEHFGVTAPGEAWKAIEEGRLERDGDIPFNPGGGLMGTGHPVGATGVRMMLDAARQVSGQAGDLQLDVARTVAMFNVGGSGATNCAFVVGAEP